MICEFCGAELSAGDISVISIHPAYSFDTGSLDSGEQVVWGVVCRSCDKTQSSKVEEKDGTFYVTMLKGGDTD